MCHPGAVRAAAGSALYNTASGSAHPGAAMCSTAAHALFPLLPDHGILIACYRTGGQSMPTARESAAIAAKMLADGKVPLPGGHGVRALEVAPGCDADAAIAGFRRHPPQSMRFLGPSGSG